ncbi:MAG: MBL fold metallo-hydrolase [Acidobacteriia bacterium]|nr:MBL fold metallo-hydrolase [Terriglobia bacterium]
MRSRAKRPLTVRLAMACLVFLAGWAAYTQTESGAPLTPQRLQDDLYVIEGTTNGENDVGNVTVYITPEGVILVDDRFAQDYRGVVAAVKAITTQPIRYVINTHHHGDHTGSNSQFLPAVEIIAHANARKHMTENKMPGPPPIVFTDETDVYLGGKQVRVIYNGRGHTDGDVAVYFPEARAVALGDLLAGTRGVTNPVVDYTSGGSIRAWPATLDSVLALNPDIVIPGHGRVTNGEGLRAHRNKVAAIEKRVSSLVHDGRPKDDIGKILVTEFDYKPINLRSLDGMMAELSAAAR